MKIRTLRLALAAGCALTLAACSGEEDGSAGTTATVDDAVATASTGTDAETASATAAGGASITTLAPVPCEDAAREPTELEQSLLVEAGAFSGDAFEQEAAAAAVVAMNPGTDQEWADAVIATVQGDHAEDTCRLINFTPGLGDAQAQPTAGPGPEALGTNHFSVVLDASGSMAAAGSGGTRMDDAKAAIEGFVDELPAGSTISLRVYGHEGSNDEAGKAESCKSSEVVYEGASDAAGLATALDAVEPTGWTPLAAAIEDSQEDIPEDSTDAIVYVVTDGLETCGGDPVKAAEELSALGVKPVVNVIGFQVGDADQEALSAIAEAGGGTYTSADSAAALEQYWREERSRFDRAWQEWKDLESERLQATYKEKQAEARGFGDALVNGLATDGNNASSTITGLSVAGDLPEDLETQRLHELVSAYFDERHDYVKEMRDGFVTGGTDEFFGKMGDLYQSNPETRWSELYADQ